MNELESIEKHRKLKGLSWKQLADGLPIAGNSLRVAFKRGSVDSVYLEHVITKLGIQNIQYEQPDKNDVVHEPDAIWVSYESYKLVPLVTQRAQAGLLNNWDDDEYLMELPKIPWEVDREYKGRYLTFEVSGDSMESDDFPRESIYEGDLLLCREVTRQHWRNKLHIKKWDFIIIHRDMGILAKRIVDHNMEKGELKLHSLNTYYEDQIVKLDDLLAIFNIIDVKRNRKRR